MQNSSSLSPPSKAIDFLWRHSSVLRTTDRAINVPDPYDFICGSYVSARRVTPSFYASHQLHRIGSRIVPVMFVPNKLRRTEAVIIHESPRRAVSQILSPQEQPDLDTPQRRPYLSHSGRRHQGGGIRRVAVLGARKLSEQHSSNKKRIYT